MARRRDDGPRAAAEGHAEGGPRAVIATYRLQLQPAFDFDDAAAVVPYLAELGISHVYCSPYLATVPGSLHGYDVVDHRRLRDDLGGDAAFERFVASLDQHGLGQIVDIVPHHMSIVGTENTWWWDVLRFGRRSRYAGWFDIDWNSPEPRLRARVLLPVLGDHYGRELEAGELRLEQRADASFVARYHELTVPLSPASEGLLLGDLAAAIRSDRLAVLGRALVRADHPEADIDHLEADVAGIHQLVVELLAGDEALADSLQTHLGVLNADVGRLDAILALQHHRLARWQVGAYELDYRRFFDIDSLIVLRTDRREVFDATHDLILRLVSAGIIDGVRVDHVDGLRDPARYLAWLRDAVGPSTYVVVEKILADGEALRAWPVQGTTGYDAAALITGVLVDPVGAERLRQHYVDLTGRPPTYREVSTAKRRFVAGTVLASDVERLTNLLVRSCEDLRDWRDFTRAELRDALTEVLVHMPVYRTYVRVVDGEPEASEDDYGVVDLALAMARDARPDLDPELFDLLRAILLMRVEGASERELALRFQQLSGPVVAKGDEDAAHYAWGPLLARNEVGVDPDHLAVPVVAFHEAMGERQARWPRSMTSTATHDTKRSEDVRARLVALSEVPDEWSAAFGRWWTASAPYRSDAGPDRATAWFVLQTLVGAHPISSSRAVGYVEKAMREAREQTSWLRPDAPAEAAVAGFVEGVLQDTELLADLDRFVGTIELAGHVNALAQVALRVFCPGVPDTYQGAELWDGRLVDPDNRQPVDFATRHALLDRLHDVGPAAAWAEHRAPGLPKLALLQRGLALRRQHPDAFGEDGTYSALTTRGAAEAHALGFVRGGEVAVVVPLGPVGLEGRAAEVEVSLPAGRWTDALTGQQVDSDGWVTLERLIAGFPVAVLVAEP